MKRALTGPALLAAAALVLAVAGGAATLPGGSSIDAAVTFPADGAVLPAAPFTATGTASVGTGQAVANTTLIYIVDVSGSTSSATGGTLCGNRNAYDATGNTTLDCELAAVHDLNQAAVATGTVAKIGMIGFAGTGTDSLTTITSAATLDLDPVSGQQALVDPSVLSPGGYPSPPFPASTNLDWVLMSAYLSGGVALTTPPGWPARGAQDGFTAFTFHNLGTQTNYYAALQELRDLIPSITTPQTEVVFLSDGQPNLSVVAQPLTTILNQLPATFPNTKLSIDTFAVTGAGSTCGTNPPASANGSLQQIAAKYGKTCHPLANPEDATDAVPDVIAAKLTAGALTVDGNPTPTTVGVPLPATGPVTASLTSGPLNLPAGDHTICATAAGSDGGGPGTAGPNCVTFTIKTPPTIDFGTNGGSAGTTDEGTAVPVSASVDNGPVTSHWGASGGTGTCTFDNPSALSTNVTCTDDGVYTLTLTADDGVNPPVSQSETLTVNNVPPTVTLDVTPHVVPLSAATVHASAPVTDPGADTWSCVITWGDGTTDTFTTSARSCDHDHTYTAAGPFPVHVQVTDDDGGTGGADAGANVQGAPTITGLPTDGGNGNAGSAPEGSPFAVTGVSTDQPATYSWQATGGTGTCTFDHADAANPAITCDDDGTYLITVSATDSFGQTSHGSFHLLVTNVAPQPTLTLSSTSVGLNNAAIGATIPFTDPGNDQWTCSVDWGDGAVDTFASTGHSCDHGHTYTSAGHFTVVATVTDDDHGVGTASGAVDVAAPPAITGLPTDGPGGSAGTTVEGSPFAIGGTVPSGVTVAIIAVLSAPGACTVATPASLPTSLTCNDNGVAEVTVTATDGFGQVTRSVFHVLVTNASPSITVSSPTAGSSPRAVTFTALVSDPGANDQLTCTIDWGDGTVDTVALGASSGTCNASHTYLTSVTAATVTAWVTDDDGGSSAHQSVPLTFNRPPVCVDVHGSPATLWPPNHQLVLVTLSGATDADGDPLAYTVTGVRQDEPLLGTGSGDTSPDARLATGGVWLRAERAGTGDGRVYTVSFRVEDPNGGACTGSLQVTVVHDQAHGAVKTPGVNVNSLG